jgi:hypothetical protein
LDLYADGLRRLGTWTQSTTGEGGFGRKRFGSPAWIRTTIQRRYLESVSYRL